MKNFLNALFSLDIEPFQGQQDDIRFQCTLLSFRISQVREKCGTEGEEGEGLKSDSILYSRASLHNSYICDPQYTCFYNHLT